MSERSHSKYMLGMALGANMWWDMIGWSSMTKQSKLRFTRFKSCLLCDLVFYSRKYDTSQAPHPLVCTLILACRNSFPMNRGVPTPSRGNDENGFNLKPSKSKDLYYILQFFGSQDGLYYDDFNFCLIAKHWCEFLTQSHTPRKHIWPWLYVLGDFDNILVATFGWEMSLS
jgi:hypothetical protein